MRRVAGYDHGTGAHCGSTSLHNLSRFYGWGLGEAACFGLGSGLGFTYFEPDEQTRYGFVGRPRWLEGAFFEHLAIPHTHEEPGDWETEWDAVTDAVDGDDPTMVFTDLYYLNYYGTDTHFAAHSLLAVGYDPDARTVLLSDSEFEELQELPVERFRAATGSTDVTPLRHRYLVVDDPEPERSVPEAARRAIRTTARFMLDPTDAERDPGFGSHGVPAMRAMAEDMAAWSDLPDPTWTARFAYQNVERRGTGGGAFRRLYADFLEAYAAAAGAPADAGDRMRDIADDWTAWGETLKAASETDGGAEYEDLVARAADELRALADREAALFRDLRQSLPSD